MYILLIIVFFVLIYLFINSRINKKYEEFVREHSLAIKSVKEINKKYDFKKIQSFDMENRYDNEVFYDSISPRDYLTYQLIYIRKDVISAIRDTAENKRSFNLYQQEVKNECKLKSYDTTELLKNEKKLEVIEKRLFKSLLKGATIDFDITVRIVHTNIKGAVRTSKKDLFYEDEILEIIEKLSHKNGDYYLDEDIWQSICLVERGKVSNRMRFSIYERDGYRCRKCGTITDDLEIDHIFPISKGGKSTYDNLQTLCHRCNSMKSNTIERGAVDPRARHRQTEEICPNCDVNLVIRKGRYGDFYGCPNYPKCKYTKQINKHT